MKPTLIMGIDGGGSKCKARLEDASGTFLSEFTSGPANPMRDPELAKRSILDAIEGALAKAGKSMKDASHLHVVAGLAGLNIPACMDNMNAWHHPFAGMDFTTDLHIACVGAHESPNGSIVIIGTGSSAVMCSGSKHHEYGGHGFLLGDKGSGAWFGVSSIRLALLCEDGIASSSPFVEHVKNMFACNNAQDLVSTFAQAAPAKFATIAPVLLDYAAQGDKNAVTLVKDGAQYLNALCEKVLTPQTERFSLIGGLSQKLKPWLSPSIQKAAKAPLNAPEIGAILIARTQLFEGKISA